MHLGVTCLKACGIGSRNTAGRIGGNHGTAATALKDSADLCKAFAGISRTRKRIQSRAPTRGLQTIAGTSLNIPFDSRRPSAPSIATRARPTLRSRCRVQASTLLGLELPTARTGCVCAVTLTVNTYIYIYIYIERERDIYVCIYIYIYIQLYIYIYT